MKKVILILLTVLLAVSCSQVVYDKLPPEDIGGASTTIDATQQDETSKNLVLKFKPVPYVSSYAYSFSGNSEKIPFEANEFKDGFLTYIIYAARIPSNDGTVELFGRSSNSSEWKLLATVDYTIKVEGESPDAYVYARNRDNVVIKIDHADGKEYLYNVITLAEDGAVIKNTGFIEVEEGKITINELNENDSYFFRVYQKESLSEPDPVAYTPLEVTAFDGKEITLTLTTDNSGFIISGIKEGTKEIELKNQNNSSLSVVEQATGITDGTITVPFSEIPSLESGLFYVVSTEGTKSNNLKGNTPISIISTTPNYRSVDLTIKFSPLIDVDDIVFSGRDGNSTYESHAVSVASDNIALITISNLDSKTQYDDLTLEAVFNNEQLVASLNAFKTKSFGGMYFEWSGDLEPGPMASSPKNDTNFRIYVEESPSGSIYPYYVYFSNNDADINSSENYSRSNLRIMPLMDSSEGLDNPDPATNKNNTVNYSTGKIGNIDVTLINEAYKKNSLKWNGYTAAEIQTWYIENSKPGDITKDFVRTVTWSHAVAFGIIPMDADTETSFYFMENDIDDDGEVEPFVKFYNYGETASLGLYKNANADIEWKKFEGSKPNQPEYTFYLSPVDISEGGAE